MTEQDTASKTAGGVFAVKTDTVWGLGAWLDDEAGIRELMSIKSRGLEDVKVFAIVLGLSDLLSGKYAALDESAREMVTRHQDAPLTLVLPKNPEFKHWYFDNFPEIGVRFPSSESMRELAEEGVFLLTSANRRGGEPAETAEELREIVGREVEVYGKAVAGASGAPTTVARIKDGQIEVLRQGEIKL